MFGSIILIGACCGCALMLLIWTMWVFASIEPEKADAVVSSERVLGIGALCLGAMSIVVVVCAQLVSWEF